MYLLYYYLFIREIAWQSKLARLSESNSDGRTRKASLTYDFNNVKNEIKMKLK